MKNPEVRASQVVTTFGPGAMMDLPDQSVLIAGLDHWVYESGRRPLIQEHRLAEKVSKLLGRATVSFCSPPPKSDKDFGIPTTVGAWRFPRWYIVQRTVFSKKSTRSRKLVHESVLTGGKFDDPDSRKKEPVIPIRFVQACPAGHLSDISWPWFVHQGGKCTGQLWIDEEGTSGALNSVVVRCECGAKRSLSEAANKKLPVLGKCRGMCPWLGGDVQTSCQHQSALLIRSASNAYFPQKLGIISIPDVRGPLEEAVGQLWENFLVDVETMADLERQMKKPIPRTQLSDFKILEVFDAINRRKSSTSSDRKIKDVEFEALADSADEMGSDVPDGDFYARALPETYWRSSWMENVERVVLVHRLREVVALVGFTRFEAAGPDISGELNVDVERAPISQDADWIPAIENRGEGIFIRFKSSSIESWLQSPAAINRAKTLQAGFDHWSESHPKTQREFPGLPFYMLHTLSHLLMTSISLECGYPSSSLRERIYAKDGQYGILIYTGSSDAEGTLGGLVEAGRRIQKHFLRALESGVLCSNDPVCAFHRPSDFDGQQLLGGACHGCALIAETSCEQHNEFLDRALVVPTVERLGAEFFRGVV